MDEQLSISGYPLFGKKDGAVDPAKSGVTAKHRGKVQLLGAHSGNTGQLLVSFLQTNRRRDHPGLETLYRYRRFDHPGRSQAVADSSLHGMKRDRLSPGI